LLLRLKRSIPYQPMDLITGSKLQWQSFLSLEQPSIENSANYYIN